MSSLKTAVLAPVHHRVFAGVLKHHYLQKTGKLAYQKDPLTGQSNRQRIGYQLLVDDTDPAFMDLHLADIEDPRLELVDALWHWRGPALSP